MRWIIAPVLFCLVALAFSADASAHGPRIRSRRVVAPVVIEPVVVRPVRHFHSRRVVAPVVIEPVVVRPVYGSRMIVAPVLGVGGGFCPITGQAFGY